MNEYPFTFTADCVAGAGRGRTLGTPTINLSTTALPDMDEGIYACTASVDGKREDAVMHYGPRPVYDDPVPTCEIHLLDLLLKEPPERLEVTVKGYIRKVQDFPSVDAMRYQIERDIDAARAMLADA